MSSGPKVKQAMQRSGLLLVLAVTGCDQNPADLINELQAARGECDQEKLKASDEECVQMFERYAEKGQDAIETYIGAVRALDQALQRKGDLQFDTTGLGHVLSAGLYGSSDSLPGSVADSLALSANRLDGGSEPWAGTSYADRQRAIAGGSPGRRPGSVDNGSGGEDDRSRLRGGVPTSTSGIGAEKARGVLLPPEQRLRRPWIDDEPPPPPPVTQRARGPRSGPDVYPEIPEERDEPTTGSWFPPGPTAPR